MNYFKYFYYFLTFRHKKSLQKKALYFFNNVSNYKEATCLVNLDFKLEALFE